MGSIYYSKDKRRLKRWRVQIRHRGFPAVSRSFKTEREARAFLKKANSVVLKEMAKRGVSSALKRLEERRKI